MVHHQTSFPFWQRLKRRISSHIWPIRILAAVIALGLLIVILAALAKPALDIVSKILIGPRMVASFLSNPEAVLSSHEGRTNLLILGASGGEHEGADLTDTMIFVSVDLRSGDVAMLSIPRDIWLDSLGAKINTAYHYGEEKSPGSGFVMAKDAVYQITGQPIDYTILIDFTGFVKAIDLVGGVEVNVERGFTDRQYPVPGKENDDCQGDKDYKCRYETISFEKGLQHMNGETALKFVRSRHAEGEEGTDFARSARQQKVILALKDKILSTQTLFSPTKLLALKQTLAQHVKMDEDLSEDEMAGFGNLFWRFVRGNNTMRTLTLDTGTDENPGFLINPPASTYGQWVLVPKNNSWQEFQQYLKQKLESKI